MVKNPFLTANSQDEQIDDGPTIGKSDNPFLVAIEEQRKRREEEEKKKYEADALKKQQDTDQKKADEQKKEDGKNVGDHLLDAAGAVGNFFKDAAVDVYETGKGAVEGVGNVLSGQAAADVSSKVTDEVNRRNKEWSEKYGKASDEQWKDPEFVKEAQAAAAENAKLAGAGSQISQEGNKKSQSVDTKKTAFQAAETFLNLATLGVGKSVAKQGAKELFKQAVKEGGEDTVKEIVKQGGEEAVKQAAQDVLEKTAKSGAKKLAGNVAKDAMIGAAYGVTQTGKNDPDAQLNDYLINMAFGAGIGGAVPIVGAGLKKGFQKIKGEPTVKLKKADPGDVNSVINDAIDEQSNKYAGGVVTKVKNWVGDQVDPYRSLAKIDREYSKTQGIKHSALDAGESLEDLARRSAASERQAAGLFTQKTRTGQSAEDLVKKYKGDSAEGKEFNNYTNAKFDLEFRAKNGDQRQIQTGLATDQLEKFVKEYETKNPDALKDLETKKAINDMAVDYMAETKAISKEEAEQIKGSYKYAVPLERIFPDDLARPEVTGRNLGSIAKQTVIQKLEGGSDIPLSNSFDTMLNRVYKSVNQGNRAKLAQKLLERQQAGLIKGSELTVGAGNKEARIAIRDQVREINKGVKYLNKKVQISSRQADKIKKELDQLNVQGLETSLSATRGEVAPRPVKTVTVKTVGEQIKDNAPKTLDDLKQSYNVKAALLKEYGAGANGIQQMAADIHNGGWTQLMALNPNISKQTATSIASQILKKPTVKGVQISVKEGKIGRATTAQQVIRELFSAPPKEVQRIRDKIAVREPKLAGKIDEVLNYQAKIEANKSAKTDLKSITAELIDDPTTGKQIISGIMDGQGYKMEIPPDVAKAIMGLDQQKLPSVLKALAIAKKPFEVAWTGILNPVFSAMSFAFYDTPMSIINSAQGFKTLGPKAVIESIKSIRASSEFQQKLAAEGARPYGGSGASSFIKPDAKSIAAQRNILTSFGHSITHPEVALSKLDIWGGKLANMTRTRVARAAYDDAIKKGATEKEAVENAALAYRTIMPDFDTMSNLTRQINSVVPFYAASVAGTRSFGKALRRDPVGTSAKALALGVAPTIGVTAFSLMSPQGQAFYKDMEQSGKTQTLDDNMIVVLPGAHKDDETGQWTGIVKVPLAPEFRAMNATTWKAVRGAMGGDGPDGSRVALSLFDSVTGGVRTSQNPLIDSVRILAGQDPRTGEQIVKGDMANLPKEEQTYDSTSDAGKFIGKLFSTSPIQGDKLLQQFGLVGQTVKNGGKPVQATVENVQNRFTGAYGDTASSRFFDTYSPIKTRRDKVSHEVTSLVKQGKFNEARRKATEFNETLKGKFADFNSQYGKSSAYDPQWDDLLDNLHISTSEKSFKSRKDQ